MSNPTDPVVGTSTLPVRTCAGRTNPRTAPDDYAGQLRDAILLAEAQIARFSEGGIWEHRAERYAAGLRAAGQLYGLREGADPVRRNRYPHCTAVLIPCDPCRAVAERRARDYVASVGDIIGVHAAGIPTNVTQVRDGNTGDEWVRLTGDDRYIRETFPDRDDTVDGPYDWGTVGGGGYADDDLVLIDMAPLTVQKITRP